ncbi:TPA: hypothetical protein P3R67_005069 [Klebsiella pneumoniae]|uniref:hypothetical protein n=1 Tax=Klebsiella pneumoniae TaxID=573 RepID=UPI0024A817E3|nr:hypothetical protein [Klebsiella pneumoniae]HDO7172221.1 hypothetical protein [Klebsiella pneumoniae]HDO7199080.1 hypothetical protein [Klebsiella pneumoniae]
MVNLEQIKADIAARKAMPAWGANTSIERIKTINATLPSFSLKTVEALVERIAELEGALEVSQGDLSDTEDAMHLWAERARKAESELESRTVTVKLPDCRNTYKGPFADEVEHQVRLALELFSSAAGIKVEAGTFRENGNSSTVYFREISETSTKGGNQ